MAQLNMTPTMIAPPPVTEDIGAIRDYVHNLSEILAKLSKDLDYIINGNLDVNNIRANSITAVALDVQELSAITANMGHITAGTMDAVTVNSSTINSSTMNTSTLNSSTINTATMNSSTINSTEINTSTMNAGTINSSVMNSSAVYGSLIATSLSGYPRAEMSATENMFKTATISSGSVSEIGIESQDVVYGVPAIVMDTDGVRKIAIYSVNGFTTFSGSDIVLFQTGVRVGTLTEPRGFEVNGQIRYNNGAAFGLYGVSPATEDLAEVTSVLNTLINVLQMMKIIA